MTVHAGLGVILVAVWSVTGCARLVLVPDMVAMTLLTIGVRSLLRMGDVAIQAVRVLARIPPQQLRVLVLVAPCAIVSVRKKIVVPVAVGAVFVVR